MDIISLTKKQLREALDLNTYWQNKEVVMPKSKARWLLKNERIEEDDYVAIIGLENTQIIGYTLIVPDIIQTKDHKTCKIHWIHIWCVDKNCKDGILGPYIFNKTIKILNQQVLLNSYQENTNKFFDKGPFEIINKRLRYTVFFNLEPDIIISKFPIFKYVDWLIVLCNKTIVKSVNYLNQKKLKKITAHLTYEYLNELDEETWEFLSKRCQNDFTVKTKSVINWHIDNSQYTQTPISKKFKFSYYSTGFSENIYSYTLKILEDTALIGFISYVVNGMEFNLKYFICKDNTYGEKCMAALMEHFFKSKASYIITDDTKLVQQIKNQYKPVFTYQIEKKTIAHKNMGLNFEDVLVTDRDGRFH
ncbi:hypothetical protein [Yeosuana marina]|uniref:hypothetical protein n=1 Tax=Yeosuana marina TaxID=1565536 RepID=UPI0030EDC240